MASAAALRPPRLTVDLAAVAENWRILHRTAAPAACGACLKADAYGMGLAPVARALWGAGCREYFVATAQEGAALRAVLPQAVVYVLGGYFGEDRELVAGAGLIPALNDLTQIDAWLRDQPGAPAALQIDTGMARLGLTGDELERLASDSGLQARLEVALLVSHLACADNPSDPRNAEQRERFEAARKRLGVPRCSLAASSGLFLGPAYRYDLARPGAALFGVNPQPELPSPMRAVVHLEAPVLQLRTVHAATGVGYGATFRAAPPARLAAVGIGYADGYPRAAGNRARVRIAGQDAPVVGRVSMDVVTVDVSGLSEEVSRPGAPVSLLDADYGVDALGAAADTIGYEILTRLGSACERRYVGGPEETATAEP